VKDIYRLSFLEVGSLFRKKELSPVDLVENIFERMDDIEPHLNAFITLLKEEAHQSAKKAERIFLKNEEASILCGIPFNVKDIFFTKGIKTTCGSRILKDYIPNTTATILQKIQNQGAVLLGKTNMLEFAFGIVHPDYGQTNNPWDYSKTSGGSSGGSAASIAAGLGYFSLGTDTGGSTRIPASYCGIAGLKPTFGLLSVDGVFPLSKSLDHVGPMAKSVEEVSVLMDILTSNYSKQKGGDVANTKPVLGILPESEFRDVNEDVVLVYQSVLTQMERMGWKMKTIEAELFLRAEEILMNVLLPEAANIHKKWLGRKDDYAPLTYHQLELGANHKSLDYVKAKEELTIIKDKVNRILHDVDLIFMPTIPYPAPEEDPSLEVDNEIKFTGLFNLSGHPALSMQGGFSKDHLPVGIQLVGKHYGEKALLKIAIELEKQLIDG
jgi:aspartyl-tRNA(Asn)/glutamyl-tRNA(Gln) amidotransferase subunit A